MQPAGGVFKAGELKSSSECVFQQIWASLHSAELFPPQAFHITFRVGFGCCVALYLLIVITNIHIMIWWLAVGHDGVGSIWCRTIYGPWVAGSSKPFFCHSSSKSNPARILPKFSVGNTITKGVPDHDPKYFWAKNCWSWGRSNDFWSKSPHSDSQQLFAAAPRKLPPCSCDIAIQS